MEQAVESVGNIVELVSNYVTGSLGIIIDVLRGFYASLVNALHILSGSIGLVFSAQLVLPTFLGTAVIIFFIIYLVKFLISR